MFHSESKTPPPRSRRRESALTLIPQGLAPTHVGGYVNHETIALGKLREPGASLLPSLRLRRPRLKRLQLAGTTHRFAQFRQGADFRTGAGLDEHIAKGSGFSRPGEHHSLARIRRELVQELVLSAATDDMDDFNVLAGYGFKMLQDCLILQRQTLQSAAHQGAFGIGHRLARFTTELANSRRHVG